MDSDNMQIAVSCGVLYKGYIWAPCDLIPVLYKISIETEEVEIVAEFSKEDEFTYLYEQIIAVDNKLYLMPRKAKSMAVYDIYTADIEYFDVAEKNVDSAFGYIRTYNNKIYLFPANEDALVVFDLLSETIERIDVRNKISNKYNYDNDALLFACGCSLEDNVYLPLFNKGIIVKFNCNDNKIDYLQLENSIEGIRTASLDNDSLVLSDLKGNIWEFNLNKNKTIKIMDSSLENALFVTQINNGHCIFFIPAEEDFILYYSKQNKNIKKIHVNYTCRDENSCNGMAKYEGVIIDKNNMYVLPRTGNEFSVIDVNTLQVHYIDTCISYKEMRTKCVSIIKRKILLGKQLPNENNIYNIQVFICAMDISDIRAVHLQEDGINIYKVLK